MSVHKQCLVLSIFFSQLGAILFLLWWTVSHQHWTVQPALQYIWFFCPFYSTVLLKMLNLLSNCRLFCSQDQVLKYKFQHWYWCIVYILTACQGVSIVKWVDDWPWDQKVSGSGLTASLKIQTHVCMDVPCLKALIKYEWWYIKTLLLLLLHVKSEIAKGPEIEALP